MSLGLFEPEAFIRETDIYWRNCPKKSTRSQHFERSSRVGTKPTEAVRLFYSIVNYNQIVIGNYLLILYTEVLSMTMVELIYQPKEV